MNYSVPISKTVDKYEIEGVLHFITIQTQIADFQLVKYLFIEKPTMQLSEIRAFYPENLHARGTFLLREYLQCKILEILFQSKYALKFAFIGGTCLRLLHRTQRFSEDLDFDNFDLSENEFIEVSTLIKKELELQGYTVEIKNVFRGAFHCYVRFPGVLFSEGLSGHKEAKITINLDTEAQHFAFEPDRVLFQKFDIFTTILSAPIDLLLSQKIAAIAGRKRPKGRDFYDTTFLFARTTPDYRYLSERLGISNKEQLKAFLRKECAEFDFDLLAQDVAPFLFYEKDLIRVKLFREFIETL